MPIRQRNSGPDEHGGERLVYVPSHTIQATDKHITSFLVALNGILDTVLRTIERDDAGNLQWLENSIVEIALDLRQRSHHFPVPDAETHPPARHVVSLGESIKLHANVLRSRHLEKTRRLVAVKHQVGIREIMNYDDVVFLCKGYDFFEELQIHNRRRWVVRKVNNQNLRPWKGLPVDTLKIIEEMAVLPQLNASNFSAGNDKAVHMNGVGRRGRQHDI